MLEDIIVEEHIDAPTGKKVFYAYLAIARCNKTNGKFSGADIKKIKFYYGSGETSEEARDTVLDALIGHLIELKTTKRFPL